MTCKCGDIVSRDGNTDIKIIHGNGTYILRVPDEAISDLLEEKDADCVQFVLDNQETFEDLAKSCIPEGADAEPVIIGLDTLKRYFYSDDRKG
jgi:hypothetical protein